MNVPAIVRRTAACFLGATLAFTAACTEKKRPTLPALGADIEATSVSGISSGAYMAGQFQIAHSKVVMGAAIIAGGPYGCAQSVFSDMMMGPGVAFLNMPKAINGCMLNTLAPWGVPDVDRLAKKTRGLAEAGRIDPIENLVDDRLYLFSGSNDRTVVPAIVKAAFDYYKLLGFSDDRIAFVSDVPAGHAFVTATEGLACEATGKPYIVDCDYDQAEAVLSHIYGPLKPRTETPGGTFITFDQRPFFRGITGHDMEDEGVAYVPDDCAGAATCRVHIAFHGCAQNIAASGDAFIRETGYANWADANALIVLFPQAASSPMNPQGCWDWWGFTGRDYLTQDAAQITIVFRMLQHLAQPRGRGTADAANSTAAEHERG